MSIEVNATEQIIEVNATGSTIDINVTSQTVDVNATTSVIDVNVTNGPGPGVPDGGLAGQVLKKLSNADYDTYWAVDTAGVPYIGATGNVDLGEFELKAGQIEFDQTPTGTAGVAVTRWNDTVGTIETTLKGGNVILRHGRDMFERVVNKTGIQLTKAAYQAVRVSDAQGQRLAVQLAQANNDNNSADTIGLVVETIDNNQEGYIYTVGELQNINTTGSLQGETWADGDVLYLSPTTAGRITNVKPVAPQHLVVIGYVVYAHQNNGKIFVKITNGFELGELHDVNTIGATSGQVLKYNGTIWTPSSDLDTGITSLNGLTALTQTFATGTSGTDFNISSATSTHTFNLPTASATNRGLVSSSDWSTFNNKENLLTFSSPLSRSVNTVSIQQATGSVSGFLSSTDWTTFNNKQNALTNPITGTGASGQVAYWSGTNTQTGSNNLFWDNTNGRLGIGTNAPSYGLHISNRAAYIRPTNNSDDALHISNQGPIVFRGTDDAVTSRFRGLASQFQFQDASFNLKSIISVSNGLTYFNNGGGNVIIGGTIDGGQRLQVQGDAFIRGSGNTSATTALTIQNSSAAQLLTMQNDGVLVLGSFAAYPQLRFINNNTRIAVDAAGTTSFVVNNGVVATQLQIIGTSNLPNTSTSGSTIGTNINIGFAPTSGTASWVLLNLASTINQTGGANGITRGLYVNPTLTAAADWRSIEWSNNTGWGLYGAGTSNNFLNGALGIGSTNITQYGLRVNKTITGNVESYNIGASGVIQSDVTSNAIYFDGSVSTQAATYTISNVFVNRARVGSIGAGTTITNLFGYSAESSLTSGTNNFGFYGNIPSGTNRWNLYMNGTANNYMAGKLGIGTVSITQANLRVGLPMTGSTTHYGIWATNQINSDVTSLVSNFQSSSVTQAATFTLGTFSHFRATDTTKGAGSTITINSGFRTDDLTFGTFNYGYYGDLSSGSNKWNLYMNGTAANYLNGNTIIGGSAVDGGQKLQVNGETVMYGTAATSGTNALRIFNTNIELFRFRNDGAFRFINGTQSYSIAPQEVAGTLGALPSNYSNSLSMVITNSRALGGFITNGVLFITKENSDTHNNSLTRYLYVNHSSGNSFAPTSGTGTLTMAEIGAAINQTGGANGITRGLYVNPTLTAAADWRSIETSNNSGWSYYGAGTANSYYGGHISIGTTNTSDWLNIAAGTTAKAQINLAASSTPTAPANGDIWFDGTDLKMRIGGVTKTFTLV